MSKVFIGPEGTKYIRFEIDIWYQEDDASIHITSRADKKFHTTVKNNPESKRCHESLYKHLQRMLTEHGKWPE